MSEKKAERLRLLRFKYFKFLKSTTNDRPTNEHCMGVAVGGLLPVTVISNSFS